MSNEKLRLMSRLTGHLYAYCCSIGSKKFHCCTQLVICANEVKFSTLQTASSAASVSTASHTFSSVAFMAAAGWSRSLTEFRFCNERLRIPFAKGAYAMASYDLPASRISRNFPSGMEAKYLAWQDPSNSILWILWQR